MRTYNTVELKKKGGEIVNIEVVVIEREVSL